MSPAQEHITFVTHKTYLKARRQIEVEHDSSLSHTTLTVSKSANLLIAPTMLGISGLILILPIVDVPFSHLGTNPTSC